MPLKLFQSRKPPKVIAIAAGKGGVGKSTVTVNLALALKALGMRVGVLDSDIYGPSMRKMLPEDIMPSQKGDRIVPALCQGIKMISMAYFRKEHEAAAIRAPIANGLINQFIHNVEWGDLDYLLVDFPPGTGDVQLTLSQQANLTGAVMVTTPQEVALLDVRKAMHLFDQVKVPIIGIIENMSYYLDAGIPKYLFGKGGGEKLACERGLPFLGAIPIDPSISRCGDEGTSLLAQDEAQATPAVKAFMALAEEVVAQCDRLQSPQLQLSWKDDFTFCIQWEDGKTTEHRLSHLQRQCPCAGCVDEKTGRRVDKEVRDNVKATSIRNVGRYALSIQFTEGCSNGIYSYQMLRKT